MCLGGSPLITAILFELRFKHEICTDDGVKNGNNSTSWGFLSSIFEILSLSTCINFKKLTSLNAVFFCELSFQ